MSNEVFEAVSTVLAVRGYQDKKIPDAILRRVVEAGHITASASNSQPWHFILVKDPEAIRELGSLVRTGPYIAGAAAAIVVAYEKEKGAFGISDASRAIQSMILAAWADGVGSNWSGWIGLEGVRQHVGLPDTYDVIAVIPLGYPKNAIKGKKKRKPFGEVVSAERFGNPLH